MKISFFICLRMLYIFVLSNFLLASHLYTLAEVRLPRILSSDMVIQRDAEIKIWGWADNGETVRVEFNNLSRFSRTSKDGKWSILFPAMKEGGPFEMIIKGDNNKITLKNILIGDIWVCSGQSNMAWTVSNSNNSEEEIKNANYPRIRLINIPRSAKLIMSEDMPETKWTECSSESIPDFSAVGYFFGRYVHKESGVPIGLINASWGGTNIEAWTSSDFMIELEEYMEVLKLLDISTPEGLKNAEQLRIKMLERTYNITAGVVPSDRWYDPRADLTSWKEMYLPDYWESGNLSGVDGVVWFRKEIILSEKDIAGEATLHLGKIDDSDITWINGIEIGRTTDQPNKNRSYKIRPGVLKTGKNVIVIKVEDKKDNGGFSGKADEMHLHASEKNYPLAGSWKFRLSGENFKYTHSSFPPNEVPSQIFNGMIHPLLNLKIKGVIWYQGESNTDRAYRYRTLFPIMINCWRSYWNQPDLPFIFVQLPNCEMVKPDPVDSWAELREAQLKALSLYNTGMAVIIDIGEANDSHPRNKQDVGYRLALNALKIAYGQDIVHMGPLYQSMERKGSKIILHFDNIGSGLMVKDKYGYIKGFTIAGNDKEFHWARAYLDGDKIVVYSEKVEDPVAVRYGWANNPDDVNIYNKEGLPASPFRTDDWKGVTERN